MERVRWQWLMRWLHVNHNEDGFSFGGAEGGGIADGKFIQLSTLCLQI